MSYIIANIQEPAEEKKLRVVDIYKEKVYKDIDLLTFKNVDASESKDVRARDAVASDVGEGVDSAVIARLVAFREAKLRNILQTALVEQQVVYADDTLDLSKQKFHFAMNLPSEFNDTTLQALAEYMHRFLVWGALYDWYSGLGMIQQAKVYGDQLEQLEEDISSILRGRSIAKRPMQPFGPAQMP